MEFVFLIISFLMSFGMVYLSGRSLYDHKELINVLKRNGDLLALVALVEFSLGLVFFIFLCGFNNTFWHLPYLTA